MWFKNQYHEDLYNCLLAKAQVTRDCEYCSALYVLAATGKTNVVSFVQRREIDFDGLKKAMKAWSHSEKGLVKLAATLFNSTVHSAKVDDVFQWLDEKNVRVAINALQIRYAR
ncbi:MAG: hypothetical protein KGZ56_00865 [Dethiobacter sp.]|nr:hypothetical protein [Dethiobacter sp.]MBS3898684.1 hypothetical protein [Dethiobacter sp.]